jgi:hypothetical protein
MFTYCQNFVKDHCVGSYPMKGSKKMLCFVYKHDIGFYKCLDPNEAVGSDTLAKLTAQ